MAEALTRGMYADGADDQTHFRHPGKFYDQHDRLIVAQVEKRSGHPTGQFSIQTPTGNALPWEPDQGYFVLDPNDNTAINIDYERMLTDRLAAREQWNNDGLELAAARVRAVQTNDSKNARKFVAKDLTKLQHLRDRVDTLRSYRRSAPEELDLINLLDARAADH